MVKASVVEHFVRMALDQVKKGEDSKAINTLEIFLHSLPTSSKHKNKEKKRRSD